MFIARCGAPKQSASAIQAPTAPRPAPSMVASSEFDPVGMRYHTRKELFGRNKKRLQCFFECLLNVKGGKVGLTTGEQYPGARNICVRLGQP